MLTPEKIQNLETCRSEADDIIIEASRIIANIKQMKFHIGLLEDGFPIGPVLDCIENIRRWTDALEGDFNRFSR